MAKKQTAMMELFDIIESQIGKSFPEEIKTHFIQMEREQIISFALNYFCGENDDTKEQLSIAIQKHFEKTFKP